MLDPTPGEAMTAAAEVTSTDVAISTAGNVTVSRPQQPALTGRHFEMISGKSAARVAATAVMWLILLAIMTVV
jgi:hypothetical protein